MTDVRQAVGKFPAVFRGIHCMGFRNSGRETMMYIQNNGLVKAEYEALRQEMGHIRRQEDGSEFGE